MGKVLFFRCIRLLVTKLRAIMSFRVIESGWCFDRFGRERISCVVSRPHEIFSLKSSGLRTKLECFSLRSQAQESQLSDS